MIFSPHQTGAVSLKIILAFWERIPYNNLRNFIWGDTPLICIDRRGFSPDSHEAGGGVCYGAALASAVCGPNRTCGYIQRRFRCNGYRTAGELF